MASFSNVALTLAMIAGFLLVAGGAKLAANRHTRGKGILMLIAALVLIMNVMIWTA